MTCIRLKAAATFVPPLTAGCRKRQHVPTVHCPWLKSVQTLAAEQRSLSHCSIHLLTKDFARRTMCLRHIIPVYRYIRHGLSRLKTIFSLATLSFQTPAGRETLRLRLAGMVTPQCYSTFAASLHVLYHPSVTRRNGKKLGNDFPLTCSCPANLGPNAT